MQEKNAIKQREQDQKTKRNVIAMAVRKNVAKMILEYNAVTE